MTRPVGVIQTCAIRLGRLGHIYEGHTPNLRRGWHMYLSSCASEYVGFQLCPKLLLHLSPSTFVKIEETQGALLHAASNLNRLPQRKITLNGIGTPYFYIYGSYIHSSHIGAQHEKSKPAGTELMSRDPTIMDRRQTQ
jgi:hypothetical protein